MSAISRDNSEVSSSKSLMPSFRISTHGMNNICPSPSAYFVTCGRTRGKVQSEEEHAKCIQEGFSIVISNLQTGDMHHSRGKYYA